MLDVNMLCAQRHGKEGHGVKTAYFVFFGRATEHKCTIRIWVHQFMDC